jgi:peptidyl-dipeptidase Dcp
MSLNRKKSLTCALTSGAFALLSGLLPLSLQGQDLSPDNPFAQLSELSLYYPPFDAVSNEDYEPAFEAGMAQHLVEIDAIVAQDAAPSFDNTIVKLELAGQLLNRVSRVFFALSGAHTNDQIQALQQQIAPQLAAHDDAIVLNADLFARIQALFADRAELGLTPEAVRLIEQYHTDFVRAGAALSREEKSRLREINGELASLQTKFSQNVLNEVNAMALVVDSREELTGLDAALIDAAAKEAVSRDLAGKYVIPLLNTSGQPALSSLQNRAVRERLYQASVARGTRGGEFDNTQTISSVLKLRAERAQLLGYATHADYVLEDATAQTTQAVNERLAALAPPAAANARREARDLQAMVEASGGDFDLAAWDWQYYSEKLRQERYAFDESQLRPYFELDNVLQRGVFFAAGELYGLRFSERFDLPVYHEDVRVFDVMEEDGSQLGIFIGDYYARPSKRGGAWMNAYVPQSRLLQTQPVVANHLNITKPAEGVATLLSFDEVTTLFHEFGHALHGLFSDVDYPSFSGTRVPRDFVEYPSQVNEMWATWPSVLANYAVHFETGEAMPQELLDKVLAAQRFNQGFATTEYLAASLLDQALHQLTPETVPDAGEIVQFEADALAAAGVDLSEVPPRYRSAYFSHIMGGYSAGYYSYIWSEVLDADSVKWFKENGGLERRNGDHFRATLLSRGGSKEAMSLFRDFRGRDADVTPLLNRRGLN